jgi:hypothetical protein
VELLEVRNLLSLAVTAVGDFNHDGYLDLAVADPEATVNGLANAGAVNIYYGTASGLSTKNPQFVTEASLNKFNKPEKGDEFGFSLAAGDFNGDGYADLAIGAPFDSVGRLQSGPNGPGDVAVFYGSATGITTVGSQLWNEQVPGTPHFSAYPDNFGYSLAAADINRDGFADLIVGVRGESPGALGAISFEAGGSIMVLYGTASGITAKNSHSWDMTTYDILGQERPFDHAGWAVAVGDFNGDGFPDVAVGVPDRDLGANQTIVDAGAVEIFYGSSRGIIAAGNQYFTRTFAGEQAVAGDHFGATLAAGDFNGDGFADLAVGIPGNQGGAGGVDIFFGSANGIVQVSDHSLTEASLGSTAQAGDGFGSALSVGNFNQDGYADLAIGTPGKAVGGKVAAGAVYVLPGSSTGPTSAGHQFWTQNRVADGYASEANAQFGSALGAAALSAGGPANLFIDVPGHGGFLSNTNAIDILDGSSSSGLTATGSRLITSKLNGPTPLFVTADSMTSTQLTWAVNASNATSLVVERSTDGLNFTKIVTLAANATHFSDSLLNSNTLYYYRVEAIDAAGDASSSEIYSARTGALLAPTGLTAVDSGSATILLAWTDNASDASGYYIERSLDGVTWRQIATVGANATSYLNKGLTSGTQYRYRVRAFNSIGDSVYSNVALATAL